MKDNKQRLFEVMGKIDQTFKPKLNEDVNSFRAPSPEEDEFGLVRTAVMRGFITPEEYFYRQDDFLSAAEQTAERWRDKEEIGSSDKTFMVQEFLNNAGIKTQFINNRLMRKI